MIEVKQAVERARQYSKELLGDQYATSLEEVELSDDGRWWFVTLGYHGRNNQKSVSLALGLPETPDFYKIFEINRDTGDVRAMKIRQVS
ncbi:MAG: hypothetical protein L0Y44_04885 [Phycisphaerales bacterium]|nr:hypothetical protein [Phycisphaerales bacterium]MCI0629972.1 hypothetical protein [Phycisphaerales bacterium]MCI0677296.1 hypothetical protein [Phycisphaerales bacterium]